MDEDTADVLVYIGDEVKALDDNGRVGGYLVRYGSPDDADLTGDYFDAVTDFDIEQWPYKSRVYYQHGLDERLKHRKLGNGEMHQDEIGVWVEAQLALRDEYEKAIFDLVKQGKMGWSSGTAGHLVEREQKGAAYHIKHWPLGLDASITPTPAEYRNSAMSLKSLMSPAASPTGAAGGGNTATEPAFAKLLPEAARTAAVQETSRKDVAPVITVIENEPLEETMPPETQVEAKSAIEQLDPKLLESISHYTIEAWQKAQKQEEDKKAVNGAVFQTPSENGASDVKALERRQQSDESQAIWNYIKTVNLGTYIGWHKAALKASNATDMNITTPADGGYAVPTGHYARIIAKRDEMALDNKLGVLPIPGKGTNVNVPIEAGTANVFVVTGEAAPYDIDAPVLGTKLMTLVKYTKRIQLSEELIEDEDSQLMPFLEAYVGRAAGLTANSALMTKVLAGGTVVPLTGNVAAAAHIPTMVYALPDEYADSAQWVMRRATEGQYRALAGNNWQFEPTPPGGTSDSMLWGFPVNHSQFAAAAVASGKALVLGNFSYVGKRQINEITFYRDVASDAKNGQTNLLYRMRFVYEVLQAGPILIGQFGT